MEQDVPAPPRVSTLGLPTTSHGLIPTLRMENAPLTLQLEDQLTLQQEDQQEDQPEDQQEDQPVHTQIRSLPVPVSRVGVTIHGSPPIAPKHASVLHPALMNMPSVQVTRIIADMNRSTLFVPKHATNVEDECGLLTPLFSKLYFVVYVFVLFD